MITLLLISLLIPVVFVIALLGVLKSDSSITVEMKNRIFGWFKITKKK